MSRILITGGGGYLARWLLLEIKRYFPRHVIYAIDKKQIDESTLKGCHLIKGDITDFSFVKKVVSRIKPDFIFHLAGSGISINYSDKDFLDMNFRTTHTLLECIKSLREKNKIFTPRLILSGSAAEYGIPPAGIKKITEDILPNPAGFYGCAKALQSVLARYYSNLGLDIVIVRPFNIIGPGMSPGTAIGNFQRQLNHILDNPSAKNIISVGNINVKRDYIDVRDVMRAICMVALKGKSGEIYNISRGSSTSLKDILKKMCDYVGIKNLVVRVDKKLLRKNDVLDITGSNEKIKSHTGWKPRITLEESIKYIWAGHKKSL